MDATTDADPIFQIVPEGLMPAGHDVIHIDNDGQPTWLIREGVSLPDLVDQLNQYTTHLVRHGLWCPQRDDVKPPRLRNVS
jgi:hypothetical protein